MTGSARMRVGWGSDDLITWGFRQQLGIERGGFLLGKASNDLFFLFPPSSCHPMQ